jgi:hypothetical protein
MRIWCIKIGIALVLHIEDIFDDTETGVIKISNVLVKQTFPSPPPPPKI